MFMKAGKICVLALTMALSLSLAATANAKDLKMAFLDLSRVFDEYGKTKEYDKVLQQKTNDFQKERDDKVEKLKEEQGKLALMKEEEKKDKQAALDKDRADLMDFDRKMKTDLTKQRDEKIREILLEIEKVASDYAKKEGYDIILNDRVLVYGDQTMNITEKVLKTLNDNYAAGNAGKDGGKGSK